MKDDQALRKVLKKKVEQIKEYPRSVQKKVEKEMADKYNVKYGDTVDMFNGISPNSIDELDYDKLYKLMKCIYEVALNSDQRIDASDLFEDKYFMKEEIAEFNIPYPEEEKDFDLVITDWKQISDTQYKIFTNIDEVIQWKYYNKLRFNPNTQRDMVAIKTNGKTLKVLDINKKSKKEMKELMVKGRYFTVCGTININPEISPIPYKDGRNLIIPKEAHMDLIEGFHNYLAATEVKSENKDWKFYVEYDLRLLSVDEANQFINQMNKKNPFTPAQVVRLDVYSPINYIVNQLNNRSSFNLNGTINDDMKVYINKLITNLYGLVNDKDLAFDILLELESGLNYIIEKNRRFKKPFNKQEWLAYLVAIKFSKENNVEFSKLIDCIDNEALFEQTKWLKEPTPKNIREINKYIKGEASNAI